MKGADMELTDAGNADRFAQRVHDEMRYLAKYSSWVFKRGGRWIAAEDEVAVREMIETIRYFAQEAADRESQAFMIASLDRDRIMAAVELAQAHVDLLFGPDELDGDLVGIEVEE
jgi:hypothetical protein